MATPSYYYVDPAAGSDTTGDGSSGTPWQTLQHALDTITGETAGVQINLKAGTADVIAGGGLSLTTYKAANTLGGAAPLIISGYSSAVNDGGLGEADCNAAMFTLSNENFITFRDMELFNLGATTPIRVGSYGIIDNCVIHGAASSSSIKITLGAGATLSNCWVYDLGTGSGDAVSAAASSAITNNFIEYDGTGEILLVGQYGQADNNVIVVNNTASSVAAIYPTSVGTRIRNNSIYSSVACQGNGIEIANTGMYAGTYENNIIEGFSGTGGTGIYSNTTPQVLQTIRANRVYNCTTAYNIASAVIDEDNTTLTASAFTNPAGGDFTTGTEVAGAGVPEYIGGRHKTTTTTYISTGASQQTPSGGGGGSANYYMGIF